ncbi:SpaA isopeptide-forming pilin-related protein [Rossellomorea marisflavi]|uniref:SpaA isopeptide-forming pilin-related protein n=1 Tax=Rossellomorea marisflavi TaxID=189381 RepID=UPI00345A8760
MKKSLSLSLIVMLIIQTLATGIFAPNAARAEGKEDGIFQAIEYLTSEGVSVPNDGTSDISTMAIHWSLSQTEVEADQSYILDVPAPLKAEEGTEGDLLDQDTVIGHYSTSSNDITVVFQEGIEDHPESTGIIEIPVTSPEQPSSDESGSDTATDPEEGEQAPTSDSEDQKAPAAEESPADEEKVESPVQSEQEAPSKAKASQVEVTSAAVDGIIEENILTEATLTYEDTEGNSLEMPTKDSLVGIDYKWALENGHGYKAGDTFLFNVPKELIVYENVNREPVMFQGQLMGYFSVNTNGKATLEFTDLIEQLSNIGGNLKIWTKLDKQTVLTKDKEIIITPIEGKESVAVPINFTPSGNNLAKSGVADRSYNAETITWTVDLNRQLERLDQAVLKDPIQEGQTLKKDSIKVYYLDTKLDGTTTLGEEVPEGAYALIDGEDFSLAFNDTISSAYRVVFETDISGSEKGTYTNKATLVNATQERGSATASVNVRRGQPLEKRALNYDKATQTIIWEVKFNYNQKSIAKQDAILEDYFTNQHGLEADSFDVEEVTIDQNGKESGASPVDPGSYNIEELTKEGLNGFTFSFNEDINAAYKITYKTKTVDRVFDAGYIKNTVTYGAISKEFNQAVGQQILFKSHGTANYKDKTIPWTITFNNDSQSMNNLVLTDDFTNKGLTIQEASLKIKTGGKELVKDTDYELVSSPEGFVVTFLKEITTPHELTYVTDFDYEKREDKDKKYLNNGLNLKWQDASGTDREKSAESNFTPDQYTRSNGFKNGSYNALTKEITWKVGVNYNQKELDGMTVEDFIQGNQKLLEDTIEVKKLVLNGSDNNTGEGETVPEDQYSIEEVAATDDHNGGFRIVFDGKVTDPYFITYKTSLEELDLVAGEYDNKATLYSNGEKEVDLTASVTIPNGGKYTGKSGVQNGKVIDWKVNINFGQSTVQHAQVIDNPSANQSLIKASFKVQATTIDANGNVTLGKELEEGKDYTLDLTKDPDSFTLQFKDEIDKPYVLTYQSLILDKVGSTVTNDISFKGDNVKEQVSESSASIVVKRTSGLGDGTGELGSLLITKKDAETGSILPGATFSLVDPVSGAVIETVITGLDGKAQFGRLLYGDYKLVEDYAPAGYVKGMEEKNITINQPYQAGDLVKTGNSETVTNTSIKQEVELTKKDAETGETLAGAEFELSDSTGNVIRENLQTDENGVIAVKQLDKGTYTFKETKAPDGYQLSTEEKSFTIKENQTVVTKVEVTNQIVKGSVELTKKNEVDDLLADAEFSLKSGDQTLKTNLKTDKDGKLIINDLRPGNYTLVETKAPIGHDLNAKGLDFTIVKDQEEPLALTFENERTTGSVQLTKKGEDGEYLEGVTFNLTGYEERTNLKTDENGNLLIEDLKPGKYTLEETSSIDGYLIGNDSKRSFTIELGQEKPLVLEEMTNDLKRGSVELTKYDDTGQSGKTLAGAVFNLLKDDKETIEREGVMTGQDGTLIVNDLKPGIYYFQEKVAPFGHELDESLVTVSIPFDPKATVKVEKTNDRSTSSVILEKVGEDGKKLSGVTFDLLKEDGTVVAGGKGLMTDDEGTIEFTGLKPGNYRFVETATIDGYVLSEEVKDFEIILGQQEPTKVNMTNQLITGSVQLKKIGEEDELLKDAEFKLVDENGKEMTEKPLVTDENGLITVDNLKPGKYQFIETKAPFGHVLDETPVEVEVTFNPDQDKPAEVIMKNERLTASVELTKEGEDGKLLEGVSFDLWKQSGTKVNDEALLTDEDGKLKVDNLKPGKYQFVETASIDGYDLDATPILFEIDFGQEELEVVKAKNDLTTGSVELIKLGEDGEKLQGATFQLRNSKNESIRTKETFTTNDSGVLTIADLKPGNYSLVETTPPVGYVLDETPVDFTIDFAQKEMKEVEKTNKLIRGSVQLKKIGEEKEPLKEAEFKLVDENGKQMTKVPLVTDEKGLITVDNLKPGKYQFIETKAPFGHELDQTPVDVEVVFNPDQEKPAVVEMKNERLTASVELTKVGEDDKFLEGVSFDLLTSSGEKVNEEPLRTDQDGKLKVDKLKPGKYQFVETASIDGYDLDATPLPFEIKLGQEKVEIVKAVNDLTTGSVELTKLGEDGKKLQGATFKLLNSNSEAIRTNETFTTNESGILTIDDLKPGSYSLVETIPPVGYVLDETPVYFTIDFAQKEMLKVEKENKLIRGSVQLEKVGEEGETLQGAEFKLLDNDGNKMNDNALVTDDKGLISVDNLKPGKYQFIETKAPFGHVLDQTPVDVEVVFNPDQKKPATVKMNNERATASAALTKSGEDGKLLKGVSFDLWNQAGTKVNEKSLLTDEDGKLKVDNLKPGKYQFVETASIDGYDLDETPIPFEIKLGQAEVEIVKAVNALSTGSIELTKLGEDGKKLQGATFKLLDQQKKEINPEIITKGDGTLTIADLKPGNYSLVETTPPVGYVLDETPVDFTIDFAQKDTKKIEKDNKLIRGSVQLEKVGEEGEALEGAEFKLVDHEGNEMTDSALVTDGKGLITVDNLKPGKYQFIETKAPFGHDLNETPVDVEVDFNPDQEKPSVVTMKNERTTSSVELTKKGEDGETLEGVKFHLVDEKGNILKEGLLTDKSGQLIVTDLKPGQYFFIETASIPGYDLDETPIPFAIELGQKESIKIEVINGLTPGSVQLTKVNEDGESLEGAIFELRDEDHQLLIEEMSTGEDGAFTIEGLPPGNYKLIETKAPFGYIWDDEPVGFTIEKNQSSTLEIEFENAYKLGKLKIMKVDEEDGRPLEGATFDVLTEMNEHVGTIKTDHAGLASMEGLKPGNYILVETEAPKGYIRSNEPIPFAIELGQESETTIMIGNAKEYHEVINPEEPTSPEGSSNSGNPSKPGGSTPVSGGTIPSTNNQLPYTGEEWLAYLMYAGYLSIAAGMVVLLARRKRRIEE